MSLIKSEDNQKWINFFLAAISVLSGYLCIKFFQQMGEWFDLEARVPYFKGSIQGLGILLGLVVFLIAQKNNQVRGHLNEVYSELVKVIWPESNTVAKSTVGILIGLTILSAIFVSVDYLFREILNLIY